MSKDQSLIEMQISSEQVLDGLLMKAFRDEVRLPNGKTGIREYIKHPGAVIMLPLFENGDTMLVRQFRYPVGKTFLELPAGKIDHTERLEVAVQRELAEEIGFQAGRLTEVTRFYPCIGYSNESMWLFIAEDLEPTQAIPDDDEFLERIRMPFGSAVAMACEGKIDDMKTVSALLLGRYFLERRSTLKP